MASPITSSATINTYLGTNPYTSDQITQASNWANEAVENYCEQVFAAANYHEWHALVNSDVVILKQRPIASIAEVAGNTKNAMSLSYTNSDTAAVGRVHIDEESIFVTYGVAAVSGSSQTLSSHASIAILAALFDSLPGWTVAMESECDPDALKPIMTVDARGGTVYAEGPGDGISCDPDEDAGLLHLSSPRTGWVYVRYNAGAVPAGLEQIATEMAATFLARKGDPTVTSEKVGNTAFTYGGGGDVMSAFYPRLDRYRKRSL